jgi:hypothetical protein
MGLWSTIKGWLNIGGVDVKLWKYTEPLKLSDPEIKGSVLFKTKSPRSVLSLEVKFIEVHTFKENDEKKEEVEVLASYRLPEEGRGLGYPLELKPGENQEEPFRLWIIVPDRMRHQGGVLGTASKVGAFLAQDKLQYFLIAEAKVKGAAFSASHKVAMKIVP